MDDYVEQAMRTCSSEFYEVNHDIEHGIIGLCTEAGELLECFYKDITDEPDSVHILEELGDVCWYLAAVCKGSNWKWEDIAFGSEFGDMEVELFIDEIIIVTAEALNLLKKAHYYGVNIDMSILQNHMKLIHSSVSAICEKYNSSIEQIQEANIKKLKSRYPDKWTLQDATQRNLDNERSVLECNL